MYCTWQYLTSLREVMRNGLLLLVTMVGVAVGSESEEERPLPLPTLGGNQFWTDHVIDHGWRIQRHSTSGHYRLLDAQNRRHTWGSYTKCHDKLTEARGTNPGPPHTDVAILVLHGLGRTRGSMKQLAEHLAEGSGWTTYRFSYASTRNNIADHATALGSVVSHLEGVSTVHFVGHSLGNIVVRKYLAVRAEEKGTSEPAVGRVVMIAPPSRGSSMARLMEPTRLFGLIAGQSGRQLGVDWEELEQQLATPDEFGVIAGSLRNGKGANPLIPGDDDLIVSVAETRLPGARDFITVPKAHTYIMDHRKTKEATLNFLRHGYFNSAETRAPIPIDP